MTSADTTVTYAYGITGMRESKTIETPSGATQTKSVWDGSALAAEQDSDGTVYRYLWGPDRTPLSVAVEYSTGATETFSYHTDALGSVVAMTDGSGSVVACYSYDPYGRCTAATGEGIATRNPLRYRAYYSDAETGLFYLPARYYDPATYRFLSRDPAAPSAGDPLSLNAYAYCLGDPVGASDPSGAIALYDDDNHVDSYEVAAHNYAHSKGAARNRWRKAAVGRQKAWAVSSRARIERETAHRRARVTSELERQARAALAGGQQVLTEWTNDSNSLDKEAGWLAGIAAVLGTASAVLTVGAVVGVGSGFGAPVGALCAGGALMASVLYTIVTSERVTRGDIARNDARANPAAIIASVQPIEPITGMGVDCALLALELSHF